MNQFTIALVVFGVLGAAGFAAYEWNCMQTANAQEAVAAEADTCCPSTSQAETTSLSEASPVPESVAAMCTISDAAKLKDRGEVTAALFGGATASKDTEHGYAFQFAREQAHEVFDYANFESDCCGFLQFTMTFEAGQGPVWLAVETAPENRPVLDAMLGKFRD